MGNGHLFYRFETYLLFFCAGNLSGLPFTIGYLYKFFFFKFFILSGNSVAVLGFLLIGMLASVVYFFRLTFYTTFDFYKGNKVVTVFLTLFNTTKSHNLIKISNLNHILAVSMLVSSSMLIYVYFNSILQTGVVDYPLNLNGVELAYLNVNSIYYTYYVYFYIIYLFIIFLLSFIVYRKTQNFQELT